MYARKIGHRTVGFSSAQILAELGVADAHNLSGALSGGSDAPKIRSRPARGARS